MKRIQTYIYAILVLLFSLTFSESLAQNDFLVIVNSGVQEDNLNQSALRRIYFGFTTQWKDFEKIKPAYVDNDDFWNYISTSKTKFKSFWTKRVFSGNGVAPEEFGDSNMVIDYVSKTKGAIGIVPKSARGSVGGNCKIVSN